MADYTTLTDLLIDQSERKLHKLEANIIGEIERLGDELKLVRKALARKTRGSEAARSAPNAAKRKGANGSKGRFDGLPRAELLALVVEMNKPAFRPADVRDFLMAKGIVRRVEAVRNGLMRLVNDGSLHRNADGSFAVHSSNGNGNGAKVEAGWQSSLESGQV
jgi:hypothetical protein